jgi:hypothetical protein
MIGRFNAAFPHASLLGGEGMSLKAFLHQLQFEPDKVKPKDWETDWEDAPLPYKLYRGLPSFPLCAEVPLTLVGERDLAMPKL